VAKIIKNIKFTAYLGLIIYQNGLSSYVILADRVDIADIVFSGSSVFEENEKPLFLGSALPFFYIPLFTIIIILNLGHLLELNWLVLPEQVELSLLNVKIVLLLKLNQVGI